MEKEDSDGQIEEKGGKADEESKGEKEEFDKAWTRYELKELKDCAKRIDSDSQAIKELQGKDVIMFMGNTGAGKSTIVNGIVSGAHTIILDEAEGTYNTKNTLEYNGRKMFRIGSGVQSCTSTPGYVKVTDKKSGNDVYFVDCPGFSDNNVDKDYSNRTIVHKLMQNAKTVRVALLINYNEMIAKHGHYALEVMTTVSRLFKDFSGIIPLVNQADEQDAEIDCVDYKFQRTLNFVQEKRDIFLKVGNNEVITERERDLLHQYNGADFPSESELDQLSRLIEHILITYSIIDPADKHKPGFLSKSKKLENLKAQLHQKCGIKPGDCSDNDLPIKLANYVVKKYIEGIITDPLFIKWKGVRDEALKLFGKVLEPWKGEVKNAIYGIMKSKVAEANMLEKESKGQEGEGWYTWIHESLADFLQDVFTQQSQKIRRFNPSEDDKKKLIFLYYKELYKSRKKDEKLVTAYELAGLVTWDDFVNFIEWLEKNMKSIPDWDDLPMNTVCPGTGMSETEREEYNMLIKETIERMRKDFFPKCSREMKDAVASRFGMMVKLWVQKSWEQLYERQGDKSIIVKMMDKEIANN